MADREQMSTLVRDTLGISSLIYTFIVRYFSVYIILGKLTETKMIIIQYNILDLLSRAIIANL